MITITPLSLSWCYTELGQGEGEYQSNPLSPFLVLHRVRAGEGCGFLGEMTMPSQKSIGRQLHVAGLRSQYVARMLECDTEPVALLT